MGGSARPRVEACALPRPRERPAWSAIRVVVRSGRALAALDPRCDCGRASVRSDARRRQFVTHDAVRRPHAGRIATSFSWGHLRCARQRGAGKRTGWRWPPTGNCHTVVHPFPFGWASFTGVRPVGEPNRGAGGARPRPPVTGVRRATPNQQQSPPERSRSGSCGARCRHCLRSGRSSAKTKCRMSDVDLHQIRRRGVETDLFPAARGVLLHLDAQVAHAAFAQGVRVSLGMRPGCPSDRLGPA